MIHPLRRRHRYVFLALAAILPSTAFVGLTGRKPVPPSLSLPPALGAAKPSGQEVWRRADLFGLNKITARLLRGEDRGTHIELTGDLAAPDLLIYWSANSAGADLPADAVLLGRFGQRAVVPANLHGRSGRLVLYSLANHEVVAASETLQFSN